MPVNSNGSEGQKYTTISFPNEFKQKLSILRRSYYLKNNKILSSKDLFKALFTGENFKKTKEMILNEK